MKIHVGSVKLYGAKLFALLLCVGFMVALSGNGKAQDLEAVAGMMEKNVRYLASDSLAGRQVGTAGEMAAAKYIYDYLAANGITMLTPDTGEDFFIVKTPGDSIRSANVIGVVEGYDPKLKNEYVVIGAHYDHIGINLLNVDGKPVRQVYGGADDNASGVAVAMEVAKFVEINKFMFRRSVIFAFFGAEESGMMGSWYFVNRSFKEIDKVFAMINLDMVGRSGGNNALGAFTIVQNAGMSAALNDVSSRGASLVVPKVSAATGFPSDHINFYEKGIPVVLFSTGDHIDCHSINDTPDKLDYKQMSHTVEYVYQLAQVLSDMDELPVPAPVKKGATDASAGSEMIFAQQDVDKRAQFLHGDERQFLDKWVYQYLKYPQSALAEGTSGRVYVEFVVDKTGKVRDVRVVKGVSDSLDDEAVKVISSSPKWKPAELNGEKVSVRMAIPVDFKLTHKRGIGIKK